ncbi:MAG: tetratricopeptide repeat protein [Nitrospinota bacterium]
MRAWPLRPARGFVFTLLFCVLLGPLAPSLAAPQPKEGSLPPTAPTPEDREAARKLWVMGYLFHEMGAYRRAIAFYQASLEKAPSAEAYTFWAWSLSHLGELDEAIRLCKKAIAVDPDFGNPYNDIGAYLIEKGRPEEAIPWLKRAMQAKRYCCPFFPHYNLGRIWAARGEWRKALASFRKALDLKPDFEAARQAIQAIQEHVREL